MRTQASIRKPLNALQLLCGCACLLGPAVASAQIGPPVVPGFPNVPQVPGTLLSGLNAPEQGRTAIIAYHGGVLFTVPEVPASMPNSDFEVRTWDISNLAQPQQLATWGTTTHPINAHGYVKSGPHLVIGPNWPPGQEWSFRNTGPNTVVREWSLAGDCIGGRGCLYQPWYVGPTYWSYNEVSGDAHILRLTESCSWGCVTPLAEWDHLGLTGVIGHPFLLGDLLIFASDQSRTGVATYDVSDPTNPVLLDVLTAGGAGGYWPELWAGDGRLYIVFPYRIGGNGIRVVDATDPTDLRFIADVPLPGVESMYAQFQDEYGFMGSYKVDMRTLEPVVFFDPTSERPNQPGTFGVDTSQFALPIGNLLVTGGVGPDQGMAIWAHQAEPDTRGPAVGFHIPQAGRTNYPLQMPISLVIHETLESHTIINGETFIVRPIGGSPIDGRLTFAFNDVLTFAPQAPLLPDTTYEVVLPEGGIKDAAGNGMEGYAFTFSTGSSVDGNQPPDINAFDVTDYPAAPGVATALTAAATDPDGDPLEFRFDLGDGSPKTAWSASNTLAVTYASVGHYRATVQVRDSAGSLSSRSTTVTVTTPAVEPAPAHSTAVSCDSGSRRVWVVNPDSDTLTAVDADTLAVLSETTVCADPRGVARTAAGELWVTCHDDDRLVAVAGAGTVVADIGLPHGSAPFGIVVAPDGNTLYVSASGSGALLRVDAGGRSVTGTLPLGPRPRALAISGDGNRIWVTRFLSPRDHAEIWDVDGASFTVSRTLRIAKLGGDANRDTTATGRGTPNYLAGIVFAPDGTSAWVTATKPNTERGLLFGPDLDSDNTMRNTLLQIDVASGSLLRAIDLDNSDSATALAFSPLGDYLAVALQGNNEILLFDGFALGSTAGMGAMVTRLGTGNAPQGICFDAPTGRTFVQSFLSRSLSVLETSDLLRSGNIHTTSTEVETVAVELLPPEVLRGKQIFYDAGDPRMSPEGYISCASCHVDGGHDGRVWDFTGRGEGLRNTTTLHGRGGMAHGNVHWSGNFDEIQDFENDIRLAFGGSGFLSDADWDITREPLGPMKAGRSADLDALAAYVSSLGNETLPRSPHRNPDGSMTAAALAGEQHFADLACASCHAGERFTDSVLGTGTLHDVGTLRTTSGQRLGGLLGGIDTPTLLGLWDTPPYFHDGSAATLADVFRVAGGDVYPAEAALPSGGAHVVDQWVEFNNDDTVRGRAFMYFGQNPAALTFPAVDGGAGGIGAIELRYTRGGYGSDVAVRVNHQEHRIHLPAADNDPPWAHKNWHTHRVDNVLFDAGPNNVIEIDADLGVGWSDISLDEIVVTTADDLALAQPHRNVLTSLSPSEESELVAYLLQLDGSSGGASAPTPTPPDSPTIPPATPTPTPTAVHTATPEPTAVHNASCPTTPRASCTQANRSNVVMRAPTATRSRLDWQWEGTASLVDFGDPTANDGEYQLCTYGGDGTLLAEAVVPFVQDCGRRPCWRRTGRTGFRYARRDGAPDGIARAQVRVSPRGARIRVHGRGSDLQLPEPIPTEGSVRIQFAHEPSGGCWEAAFAAPFTRSGPSQLIARRR